MVGQRLRAFRQAKGWTQTYLAGIIGHGVTPQKINNYEFGRDLIPPHVAGMLCDVVSGIDFDYIYRGRMEDMPPKLAQQIIKLQTSRKP